jgi:hypothetical protein
MTALLRCKPKGKSAMVAFYNDFNSIATAKKTFKIQKVTSLSGKGIAI